MDGAHRGKLTFRLRVAACGVPGWVCLRLLSERKEDTLVLQPWALRAEFRVWLSEKRRITVPGDMRVNKPERICEGLCRCTTTPQLMETRDS